VVFLQDVQNTIDSTLENVEETEIDLPLVYRVLHFCTEFGLLGKVEMPVVGKADSFIVMKTWVKVRRHVQKLLVAGHKGVTCKAVEGSDDEDLTENDAVDAKSAVAAGFDASTVDVMLKLLTDGDGKLLSKMQGFAAQNKPEVSGMHMLKRVHTALANAVTSLWNKMLEAPSKLSGLGLFY
jgi:Fe2+ or Zn2+ uptake regulation protein